jgi:N6-L-threonylcarbamoyladenine synthase
MNKKEQELERSNLAASYQKAIILSLLNKIEKCIKNTKIKTVTIAGGVAANSYLREKAKKLEDKNEVKFLFPSFEYCTDNGAMIAITASYYLKNKIFSNLELSPVPNLNIE